MKRLTIKSFIRLVFFSFVLCFVSRSYAAVFSCGGPCSYTGSTPQQACSNVYMCQNQHYQPATTSDSGVRTSGGIWGTCYSANGASGPIYCYNPPTCASPKTINFQGVCSCPEGTSGDPCTSVCGSNQVWSTTTTPHQCVSTFCPVNLKLVNGSCIACPAGESNLDGSVCLGFPCDAGREHGPGLGYCQDNCLAPASRNISTNECTCPLGQGYSYTGGAWSCQAACAGRVSYWSIESAVPTMGDHCQSGCVVSPQSDYSINSAGTVNDQMSYSVRWVVSGVKCTDTVPGPGKDQPPPDPMPTGCALPQVKLASGQCGIAAVDCPTGFHPDSWMGKSCVANTPVTCGPGQSPSPDGLSCGAVQPPGAITTGGITAGGITSGGNAAGGLITGGTTTGGVTSGAIITGSIVTGGAVTGGTTIGGITTFYQDGKIATTIGGTTVGGITTGGTSTGCISSGGSISGGIMSGGLSTDCTTTGGTTTGGQTTGGSTTGTDTCQGGQERVNGACMAACSATQERISGSCTGKCTSGQARNNAGICVAGACDPLKQTCGACDPSVQDCGSGPSFGGLGPNIEKPEIVYPGLDAPTWSQVGQAFKGAVTGSPLGSALSSVNFHVPDSACPIFSGFIPWMNFTWVVDVHCNLWLILAGIISPIAIAAYTYIAVMRFIR